MITFKTFIVLQKKTLPPKTSQLIRLKPFGLGGIHKGGLNYSHSHDHSYICTVTVTYIVIGRFWNSKTGQMSASMWGEGNLKEICKEMKKYFWYIYLFAKIIGFVGTNFFAKNKPLIWKFCLKQLNGVVWKNRFPDFVMLVFNCIKHPTIKVIVKVAHNLSSLIPCISLWCIWQKTHGQTCNFHVLWTFNTQDFLLHLMK